LLVNEAPHVCSVSTLAQNKNFSDETTFVAPDESSLYRRTFMTFKYLATPDFHFLSRVQLVFLAEDISQVLIDPSYFRNKLTDIRFNVNLLSKGTSNCIKYSFINKELSCLTEARAVEGDHFNLFSS
jgi:hypothetical protein